MRVGDLFSGIGGFSLAAHWMGWDTAWFSEIDPYASRVLAHHWPDVPNLGDIRAIDWSAVEPIDLLTAGFPCQPHSLAGKREGSNDERDLFDEIIRCAGVLRPRVLVLENVPGLFTSDAGRFFGRVLGAVAALGYDAEWRVLSAADVGAPHRRERVWITAYANGEQHESGASAERWAGTPVLPSDADGYDGRARRAGGFDPSGTRQRESERSLQDVADAEGDGLTFSGAGNAGRHTDPTRRIAIRGESRGSGADGYAEIVADAERSSEWRRGISGYGEDRRAEGERAPSESGGRGEAVPDTVREGRQGRQLPSGARPQHADACDARWWSTEPDVGRVAHGVPARVDRLRCLGNSIVPQCAYEIFQGIAGRDVRAAA